MPRSQLDLNSLVESIHAGPETRAGLWSSTLSQSEPSYVTGSAPLAGSWAAINFAQNSVSHGVVAKSFVVPAGTTSVTASCSIVEATFIAPQSMDWGIMSNAGAYVVSATITPTATPTTSTLTTAALTPGTTYYVVFRSNVAIQSVFLVANLQVQPFGASGLFAAPFNRLRVDHGLWQENAYPDRWSASGYCAFPSTMARCSVTTDATSLVLQVYNDYGAPAYVPIRVNGQFFSFVSVATLYESLVTVSGLPQGVKTVDVYGGASGLNGPIVGTSVKAIYAPSQNVLEPTAAPRPGRRVGVYGDSIAAAGGGLQNTFTGADSAWQVLGTNYQNSQLVPIIIAYGGRAFSMDCANSAGVTAFVNSLLELNLDDLFMAIGTNDYSLASWASVAAYGTQLSALITALHAAAPATRIWVQSPLSRTVETANAQGWTMPQLRTQIQTTASGFSYVTFCDGSTVLGNTYVETSDGVNPNQVGTAAYAGAIRTWMGLQ
jgi:lysophospholipase L1-like esterase